MSNRIPPVPSGITGVLATYLGQIARQLNGEPSLSIFSGTTPESIQTGIPGNIAVNIGVTDTDRVWVMSGTTARQKRTGWEAIGAASAVTFSGARVNGTGNSNASDSVATMVRWDAEEYDTDAYHSTAANTSRLSINVPGYYHVFAMLKYEANATGARFIDIYKNGDTSVPVAGYGAASAGAGDSTKVTCGADSHFTAGDYIEVQAYQTSGGARTIDRTDSHFGITRIASD
jgi:hypothetical protein